VLPDHTPIEGGGYSLKERDNEGLLLNHFRDHQNRKREKIQRSELPPLEECCKKRQNPWGKKRGKEFRYKDGTLQHRGGKKRERLKERQNLVTISVSRKGCS